MFASIYLCISELDCSFRKGHPPMFLPFKEKFLPKQNKGATIQILRETNPSPRYREIVEWLTVNKPDVMRIVEHTIHQEPGTAQWLELTNMFKDICLPQVLLTYGKVCIHIGGIDGVMLAFPAKTEAEEKPEELCEN